MGIITSNILNSVWNMKKQINFHLRRLRDLEIMASSATEFVDGVPHSKPLTSKIERFAVMIVECQRIIDDLTEQLIQRKLDLMALLQVQSLSEPCARVLNYHYVACLNHSEIAKIMSYTRNYIWKLHRQGIKALGLSWEEISKSKSMQFNIASPSGAIYNDNGNFS